jgi:hypothetical protein
MSGYDSPTPVKSAYRNVAQTGFPHSDYALFP